MAGLQIGCMKAKLKTDSVKAELEGPIHSCIVDLLRFLRVRATRERVLTRMQELHAEMCKAEDEKAAQQQQPK